MFSRVFLGVFLAVVSASTSVNQTVNLGYATYQGTFNSATGVSSFLGLRYANPPTGIYMQGRS